MMKISGRILGLWTILSFALIFAGCGDGTVPTVDPIDQLKRTSGSGTAGFDVIAGSGTAGFDVIAGSGTAGFDVIAGSDPGGLDTFSLDTFSNEQRVITHLNRAHAGHHEESHKCETVGKVTFCAPNPHDDDIGASPFSIKMRPKDKADLTCILSKAGNCNAIVTIKPFGQFQPDTRFLLAIRYPYASLANSSLPMSKWEIPLSSPFVLSKSKNRSGRFEATVPIMNELLIGATKKVDFAILVYPATGTPASTGQADLLINGLNPDMAFVVTDVTVIAKQAIGKDNIQ